MIPWFQSEDSRVTVYHGDCLETLLFVEGVDSVVTDPPYGLTANKKGGSGTASINLESPYGRARVTTGNGPGGFMGKKWDAGVPGPEYWASILAACKPGAHLLAFGGTRTFHRLACAIEDAGWEIRDTLGWLYGSGFPKSLGVSKAIDKAAGAERTMRVNERWADKYPNGPGGNLNAGGDDQQYGQLKRVSGNPLMTSDPATDAAREWAGWGTALKPAWEPIILARKPIEGTVAENVQKYGCGALNIDGCRVEYVGDTDPRTFGGKWKTDKAANNVYEGGYAGSDQTVSPNGRWPANLLHDGSEEVMKVFPTTTSGNFSGVRNSKKTRGIYGDFASKTEVGHVGDSGSAARFFYCAKASKQDRDEGCEGLDVKHVTCRPQSDDEDDRTIQERLHGRKARNFHPTVKPTDLMRYLCRLITPPGGLILDPFMGSGSTGKAAMCEQFRFVGMDLEAEYLEIAKARILNEMKQCALL